MNLDLHAGVAVLSDGASMTMRDAANEVGAVGWAWRAGGAPDVALQAARANVRSRRETSAPFYWAGWMLIGGR
jgi:hypothetical protein